jgi:acyl dehydratase
VVDVHVKQAHLDGTAFRGRGRRMGEVSAETLLQMPPGTDLGVSEWVTIDQAMIDRFADATGDHQFIHVDPERAGRTPLGGTVAHGFLTLSLMPRLLETADIPRPEGLHMGLNYGSDRLRFLSPVRAGRRIRGRFRAVSFVAVRPGTYRQTIEIVVEIEGEDKPAMIAEWISQLHT